MITTCKSLKHLITNNIRKVNTIYLRSNIKLYYVFVCNIKITACKAYTFLNIF